MSFEYFEGLRYLRKELNYIINIATSSMVFINTTKVLAVNFDGFVTFVIV